MIDDTSARAIEAERVHSMLCEHPEVAWRSGEPPTCTRCNRPVRFMSELQMEKARADERTADDVRPRAIEAIAQALHADNCPADPEYDTPCDCGGWGREAEVAYDAAEQIIRSDERITLRAHVMALPTTEVDLDPDPHGKPIVRQAVLLDDVLAVLDGAS
jgi:hypothetical protein